MFSRLTDCGRAAHAEDKQALVLKLVAKASIWPAMLMNTHNPESATYRAKLAQRDKAILIPVAHK